jgi:exodeoxyribonuclease VII small subunit
MKMTYKTAYDKLQKVLDKLKSDDISIDDLKKHVDEARKLITYCQQKLRDIEEQLQEED